jgi:putative transposase
MTARRGGPPVDLNAWSGFDASALPADQREVYLARQRAVELYAGHTPIAQIETLTGVDRRQIYRLIERCLKIHEDGRVFGYRALVPHVRVSGYQRVAKMRRLPRGGSRGAAGAFALLLEAYPVLVEWIDRQITQKRISLQQVSTSGGLKTRLRGLKHLHLGFVEQCRAAGLTAADYPFTTDRLGIGSLARYARACCLKSFARGARSAGATHLKGMPGEGRAPVARQALEVVEFDGHRLDIRLKVVVRDPLGFTQEFEIERIWLLTIIDVFSRAILGYHISLNREYSRYDVIRTIEAALEPHRLRNFTLPGVGYGKLGGFPSGKLPELGYATWQWIKLDGAKANVAEDVRHALAEFIGCFVDVGPSYDPDDRPYIERFFGAIAANLSSRMPGYTGSHVRDVRRALADPKGDLRLYVSLDELEDLIEAAIAAYNAMPHSGLNGRTPLEAIEYAVRGHGAMLAWLPERKRRTLCLMQTPRRATVRGYLAQGQRPHINFHGVRYTNPVLASTSAFLGQELRLYYNSQDLRTVRAFASGGEEVGVLKAQGAWGEIAHDLKLRQEIMRLRGRKQLGRALDGDFIGKFVEEKFAKAKRSRREASALTQSLRILSAAPTSAAPRVATMAPSAEPTPSENPPVEPQSLSIGSGYVGNL